jgi:hypothetical protein
MVLTGRSLRVAHPNPQGILVRSGQPPRESSDVFFISPENTAHSPLGELAATVAFVAPRWVLFQPEGAVREMDIELAGHAYNGTRMLWKVGGGISTEEAGEEEEHLLYAEPKVVGVVPRAEFAAPDLSAQGLRFERGVVGTIALSPEQFGAIRNRGDAAASITGVRKDGTHQDEFDFRFLVVREWPYEVVQRGNVRTTYYHTPRRLFEERQGQVFRDFADQAPMRLRPGDTLLIGGQFFPQADGPRSATLEFTTNDRRSQRLTVSATGDTIPGQPHATLLPTPISFGFVEVGQSRTRALLLTSDGPTPLLVQSIGLEDPAQGFAISLDPHLELPGTGTIQIESGASLTVRATFKPLGTGARETKLVAETNAGHKEATLRGEGVPQPQAAWELQPSTLTFGLVYLGRENQKTAYVLSTGAAPLVMQSVTVERASDMWSVASGPASGQAIPPGQQAPITLTFRPNVVGQLSGTLGVQTANAGYRSIRLSGYGVRPE